MTDKRRKPEADRRRPINCLVHPDTLRLLKPLAAHLKLSQGAVLDRAVAALAVAESFGAQHLKLDETQPRVMPKYDPVVYGDGSGLTLRRSEIVSGDPSKSGTFTAKADANEVVRQFNQWKPGAPTPVNITIPHDLIRMAREYPAIDWNEVMRHATTAQP